MAVKTVGKNTSNSEIICPKKGVRRKTWATGTRKCKTRAKNMKSTTTTCRCAITCTQAKNNPPPDSVRLHTGDADFGLAAQVAEDGTRSYQCLQATAGGVTKSTKNSHPQAVCCGSTSENESR